MARKGENIYKRKDGRYEGRYIKDYDINGKGIIGYIYGKTYKEAKEKLLFAKAKVREKQNKPPSEMSVKEWFSKWLDTQKHIKESSYTVYSSLVNKHINTSLGNMRLCDFTKLKIQDFVNGLASQWEPSTVKLIYTKPSTPEVKVNRDSTSSLTLSWNKVSGADHYIVKYRKCKAGTTKPDYETLGTVKGTSYTHKNLSKGTQYCYRVIAVKEGNLGEAGAKKQKQVKSDYKTKSGFTLFDRPKNELDNDGNVVLSWGKASGDNTYAYRIERTTASNQYTDLGRTTSLTYTDKTAPSGEICKYKITALKSDDSYKTATTIGEFYAGAKVQTKITLTPQNATTMRISWSNVKSAVNVKYVVRKYVNNAWVDVATTTNTYYDDKNLTAGNSYKYYVQVRDGSNNYLTSTFSASAVLEILPTKISLDKTAITLTEGESANLTYTISPNNVTNKNVTWTSSNSSVATVSGGTVKAVSEGIANEKVDLDEIQNITIQYGDRYSPTDITDEEVELCEITFEVNTEVPSGEYTITTSYTGTNGFVSSDGISASLGIWDSKFNQIIPETINATYTPR